MDSANSTKRAERPRLLWFKARMPGVVNDGTGLVTCNLTACLAEVFDIDLVTLRITGREDAAVPLVSPPFRRVLVIEPENAGGVVKRALYRIKYELAAFLTRQPRAVFYVNSPCVRAALDKLFSAEKYSAAVFEYYNAAPLLKLANCPTALVLIDATYKTLQQQAERASGIQGWLARWRANTMRRYEATVTGLPDACFAISPRDVEFLRDGGSLARIEYLPVIFPPIPKHGVERAALQDKSAGRIAFVGTLRYEENRRAFAWFMEHVMPHVVAELPDVRVQVFGGGKEALARSLQALPCVDFVGWVDDLGAALRGCHCGVAPSVSGTGVKIKVLEMMWYGLPVVATSVAAAGTPATHGAALVEDDPTAFARAVIGVLRDPGLREALADRAWAEMDRTHCGAGARHRVQQRFLAIADA